MDLKVSGVDTVLKPSKTCHIEYGTDPGFMPSDDKMVDVWITLHQTMRNEMVAMEKLSSTQQLYFILTSQLLERAKYYGSLERP